nr:uncharacterized protein CTRU02_10853 [Colletotrichum truncatum]KAF6786729.1 hypothetical protein CTRU02_10853 [Colletotrichum truncatum]
MKFTSAFYAALMFAAGSMAIECTSTLTYCTGGACQCFAAGVAESLNDICKKKGFERSLGPSQTTVGNAVRCDHQCCRGPG